MLCAPATICLFSPLLYAALFLYIRWTDEPNKPSPADCGALTLSARSGEREGPNRASDWEGEVRIRTHLTRSLALAPSPPEGRRGSCRNDVE
jgi:hypothetical protein